MLKLAIVGEAWGELEERTRNPFSGAAGYELTRMLDEAGIARRECFLTNVFNLRPDRNDIETLCAAGVDAWREMPPLKPGKHVHRKYACELDRLYNELSSLRPNLILALGNTASWATLFSTGISKIRGTVSEAVAQTHPRNESLTDFPSRRNTPSVGPEACHDLRSAQGRDGAMVPGDTPTRADYLHRTIA